MEPREMMDAFNRFRILSPLRKGPHGVEAINELFLKKPSHAAPIILTKNDRGLELFNGETGVLIRKDLSKPHFQEGDYAIFPGDRPDAIKRVPAVLLPPFEYAYCLSVHKSQGSEFDHVLLMLLEGSENFGNQVLYTGVTRAKRKLEIWCSLATLKKTLSHKSQRLSGISERIALSMRSCR
jgi:exodeoxyribonuclease V alpha subunit